MGSEITDDTGSSAARGVSGGNVTSRHCRPRCSHRPKRSEGANLGWPRRTTCVTIKPCVTNVIHGRAGGAGGRGGPEGELVCHDVKQGSHGEAISIKAFARFAHLTADHIHHKIRRVLVLRHVKSEAAEVWQCLRRRTLKQKTTQTRCGLCDPSARQVNQPRSSSGWN